MMSIGQLAAIAGVNSSTIRYYERRGLLPEPERHGGRRRYDASVVRRLEVIAAAKRGGFTLAEIRALQHAGQSGVATHKRIRAVAHRKALEIDAVIGHAQAARLWLAAAQNCTCDSLDTCTLFASSVTPPSRPATTSATAGPRTPRGRISRPPPRSGSVAMRASGTVRCES
jgi:DNA-binding transcriptional MerR regulator